MNQIFQLTKAFVRDEDGVTAVEYALIAALIGVAAIAGATALGANLNTMFNNLATKLQGVAA